LNWVMGGEVGGGEKETGGMELGGVRGGGIRKQPLGGASYQKKDWCAHSILAGKEKKQNGGPRKGMFAEQGTRRGLESEGPPSKGGECHNKPDGGETGAGSLGGVWGGRGGGQCGGCVQGGDV